MTFKQIAVRLPRLLDKDLNEVGRLRPKAQSIELNITPLSTASLTLEDGSGVAIRQFIEIYNAKGSAGIYRVRMPDASYGSGERFELEHGICTLDDAVVRGQGKISGTPRDVFSKILAHQTTKARGQNMWTLGVVEAPDSEEITVEHDGTKTLEMLIRAVNALEGYMLSFTQDSFPWTVHVIKKPDAVACEGRLSRNIRTIRKTIDDSELCTRLYCSLLDGGYIESDTMAAWGAVEEEITLNDSTPKADVLAYCRKYLENRKNPAVAVEMDADEWFAMTGERLDRFEIGDVCRVALPKYGVTIEERIVALSYMDALGQPEVATVSLANQITDMSLKTAEISQSVDSLKSTSTSYGNRISSSETKITNLKDTQEGIKELNGKMTHWFNSVEIDLDAEEASIGIMASRTETYSLFQDVDQKITNVGIDLDAMEAELLLYARQTTVDELGEDVNEVSIRLDAAEEEIVLKANRVYVDAQITEVKTLIAEEIEAAKGEIENAYLATVSTNELFALNFVFAGDNVSKTPITVVTGISGGGVDSANYTLMTTAEGDSYTMELGSADAIYSNGVHAKYIQGEEYTGTLYEPGSTFGYYARGDEVTSSLYYSGGSETVTLQGSEYTGTLYDSSGNMITIALFREGSSRTFYKRGSLYSSALFKDGGYKTVTKQGDMYTGALFNQGAAYSGGLYTNFEPGIVTMKPVTALTA